MSDIEKIEKYCTTFDTKLLNKITNTTKDILVDICFQCLFEKNGNMTVASRTLEYLGYIGRVANTWVYNMELPMDGFDNYQKLKRVGVVTIPVIHPKKLTRYRQEFMDTLRNFPEYTRDPNGNPDLDTSGNPLVYVLGGFAALGNPASFHNKLVRKLRLKARSRLLPLFKAIVGNYNEPNLSDNTKLQVLFDRMMFRLAGQKPVPESWHRDVMPQGSIEATDEVYGGWINLDEVPQYFSCIPGSHLGVRLSELTSGFATIPDDEKETVGEYRHVYKVPPGHIVIFPQYILHEVVSKPNNYNMMRLFTGWRLTVSDNPLYSDLDGILNKQAIVPIPGGMYPPMYAANHGSFYLHKRFKPIPTRDNSVNLIEWSENTIKQVALVEKSPKSNKPSYKVVKRYMDSLQEYGFRMYLPYTDEEKSIYIPQPI